MSAGCTIMDAKGFFTQDTDCVFQVPFGWAAAVVAVAGYLLLMVAIETTCLMICCYFVCTKKSRRSSTPVRELSTHKVEEVEMKDLDELPKESTPPVPANNPAHIYAVLEQPNEQAMSSWQDNDYAVAKDNLEGIPESQQCTPKPALLTRHTRPAHTARYVDYANASPVRSNSALPHLQSYKSLEPSHDYANFDASRHNTVQLSHHSPDHHLPHSPLRHDPAASPTFNFKDRKSLQSSLTKCKKAGSSPVQVKSNSYSPSAYTSRPLPTPQPTHIESDDDNDYDHLSIPSDNQQSAAGSKTHSPAASTPTDV